MVPNRFIDFFLIFFMLLSFATIAMVGIFDGDHLLNDGEKMSLLPKEIWFSLLHLALNFALLGFSYALFRLCDNFYVRGYGPGASFFFSLFVIPVVTFIFVFTFRGFFLFDALSSVPLWSFVAVFFISVFVLVSVRPRITDIFFLDVVLSAAFLDVFSLLMTNGVVSLFVIPFRCPWTWLVVVTGFFSTASRLFLWKYER